MIMIPNADDSHHILDYLSMHFEEVLKLSLQITQEAYLLGQLISIASSITSPLHC